MLIQEVGASLRGAGKDAEAFEGVLDGFAKDVSDGTDLKSISSLIGELINETRNMQSSTSNLRVHFEEKSREIESLEQQLQAEESARCPTR